MSFINTKHKREKSNIDSVLKNEYSAADSEKEWFTGDNSKTKLVSPRSDNNTIEVNTKAELKESGIEFKENTRESKEQSAEEEGVSQNSDDQDDENEEPSERQEDVDVS